MDRLLWRHLCLVAELLEGQINAVTANGVR
jgi:hypothetical protein